MGVGVCVCVYVRACVFVTCCVVVIFSASGLESHKLYMYHTLWQVTAPPRTLFTWIIDFLSQHSDVVLSGSLISKWL